MINKGVTSTILSTISRKINFAAKDGNADPLDILKDSSDECEME
jgi:hypothetical protein